MKAVFVPLTIFSHANVWSVIAANMGGLPYPDRQVGTCMCETVRIVTTMLVNSVVAVDRTIGVLPKALFVGDSPVIAVISTLAILSKLSRRLCR